MNNPIIGIIGGTGRIGNFFKLFFEKDGLKVLIAGRNTSLTYQKLCQQSDIVFISVPINFTTSTINQILPFLKKDSLLVDLASLKSESMEAMSKSKTAYLGIHPLFGPLITSLEGQVIVFSKGKDNKWVKFLKDYFENKKSKVILIDAKTHDKQMALIQGLVHLTNITLALTLTNSKTKLSKELSTPVFRLQQLVMARIFGQPSELYENILMENPLFIEVLDELNKNLSNLTKIIKDKDRSKFNNLYTKTQQILGSFIKVAEQKTTSILNMIDTQPTKIKLQKISVTSSNAKVAYLGPEGTYSHSATKSFFPKSKLIPVKTISDVFEEVNNGIVDFGVVPSENMIEGVVKETLGNLIDYPIEVLACYNLPIKHALLSHGKDLNKIKTVISHPQALGQCRNWLKTNLPNAKIETANSTVSAILETKDQSVAFISPQDSAKKYKVNTLVKDIGDKKNNQTEFFVISTHQSNLFKQPKTKALLLLTVFDRVGVLKDILDTFAQRGLNLSKIVSIPSGNQVGEYMFLIEVGIKNMQPEYKSCLKRLEQHCHTIRILGEI